MPPENDENQALKPKDLLFILALAGRIDTQSRSLAQKLDEGRQIYYAYAVLDSLSSSYSMYKYFFDMFISSKDSDLMHEMMLTPGGIIAIASESIFLVVFSLLACRFANEKEHAIKKFIATAWPYFRDVMKGLKNAYKGWRSALQAIGFIGGIDLKYMIVPVGLLLGIFAAANRFWLRRMVEKRKVMMGENAALLLEIKKLTSVTKEECKSYLDQIKYQPLESRILAFFAASTGGIIDGLYLYVGVLSLAVLPFPIFIAMAVVCAIYTLACIITRVYEEYDFQLKLIITQTKCKLALITKEMMGFSYTKICSLRQKTNKTEEDVIELRRLEEEVCELIGQFEETRQLLQQQTTRTYLAAALLGIKNGLYAYSAFASILFLVGTLLVMTSSAFPPALLIFGISFGLVLLIGFIIHSLRANYVHLSKRKKMDESPYIQIIEMKKNLEEEQDQFILLEENYFKASIIDGLNLDPSPQFFFQEWFEVVRSLFSGLGKGQKFVDFAGNPLQEADEQGHYHDTPVMYALAVCSAVLFAAVLGLRAFSRGLGRPPLGQVDLAADIEPVTTQELVQQTSTAELGTGVGVGEESSENTKPAIDSLPRSKSILTLFRFFDKPTSKLPHSNSDFSLNDMGGEHLSTIQGLD